MDMTGAEWQFDHHYGHVLWSLLEKYIYHVFLPKQKTGRVERWFGNPKSFSVDTNTRWWVETTN